MNRGTGRTSSVGISLTIACGLIWFGSSWLGGGEAFGQANARQRPSSNTRQRPEYQPPKAQAGLPNVLIIGDSISIGYTLPLREELAGEANVYRPATNCGPTTRGLESLEQWLEGPKWDVIHFNFGLHDLKYMGPGGKNLADPDDPASHPQVPLEQYTKNLRQIAERLRATGAIVIWRETTPVPEGAQGRVPGDSARYNQAAAEVMQQVGGIRIDPMFDYASDPPIVDQQRPANVHYTNQGSQLLAKKVADSIRQALKSARTDSR